MTKVENGKYHHMLNYKILRHSKQQWRNHETRLGEVAHEYEVMLDKYPGSACKGEMKYSSSEAENCVKIIAHVGWWGGGSLTQSQHFMFIAISVLSKSITGVIVSMAALKHWKFNYHFRHWREYPFPLGSTLDSRVWVVKQQWADKSWILISERNSVYNDWFTNKIRVSF